MFEEDYGEENLEEIEEEKEPIMEPYLYERDTLTHKEISRRERKLREYAKKGVDPTHPLRNCDSFARELAVKLLKDSGKGYGKGGKPIKERHKPLSVLQISYVMHAIGFYICSSKLYEAWKWLKERDEERN